ncbi:hypothetical protein AWU67_13605 [Microterricola viridarii]|uniref:Uncharacterized protein n=2 Tax=Microterricola viridarii TaxID=412690 RepID=A0A0X8E467_9MICO|nr:hypothetical protein AWU67_13605 [Microterricola viridarii]
MVTVAALALGAALAFTGCAAEATPESSPAASSTVEACSEVRNVTNGALNTLAGDLAADPAGKSEYFGQLTERVDALLGTVDNKSADAAFSSFAAALGEAGAYVATVSTEAPAEGAETDPALIAATTAVQDAAAEAAANCSAE